MDYLMVCNNFKSFHKGYLAAYFCKLPNTYKLKKKKKKKRKTDELYAFQRFKKIVFVY